MSDFLTRLKTERDELQEKLVKLNSFIYNEGLATLHPAQAALLSTQADVMSTYRNILNLRIELIEEHPIVLD